jgi:hypothetical protein
MSTTSEARTFAKAGILISMLVVTAGLARAQEGLKPNGVGANPVSFLRAASWIAHDSNEERKLLILMVYFEGSPGWHSRDTDFHYEISSNPATIDMTVGQSPLHVAYWHDTSRAEIMGEEYSVVDHNVFVVRNVDSPKPTVEALGTFDLTFAPSDEPARTLISRSAVVRHSLTSRVDEKTQPTLQQPSAEGLEWDREGVVLWQAGEEHSRACQLFQSAADNGLSAAQYRLGYCYQSGQGVEQNLTTANEWYRLAALQGYVDAQYKLAHSYRVGRGTEIDFPSALEWYKKAAESDDLQALHNLGLMYAAGEGVEVDTGAANDWLHEAAIKGLAASQFELARRYHDGEGLEPNLATSWAWMLVLEAQKNNFAATSWELIQNLNRAIHDRIDEEQREEGERQALDLMRSIAIFEVSRLGRGTQ